MNIELLVLGGYGQFVWPAFILTFASCFMLYLKTKKELKTAIARSMKEILAGKTPKYDIINGRTGEMIGWKDGKDYIWQPDAIPYAERELK